MGFITCFLINAYHGAGGQSWILPVVLESMSFQIKTYDCLISEVAMDSHYKGKCSFLMKVHLALFFEI